ncbi:unnamed protein product [Oikopleura dioica]|uniref:Uncharacterized protein n=1 Tax=Oikopleura dioica TaxID=34765 RepID=E4Y1J0_OIKDI|nr:unnamed protein product [Oikopleura dioica]
MGSGNSVPVDNSWKQFQLAQMNSMVEMNSQRGFHNHMPIHLEVDNLLNLSGRSSSSDKADEPVEKKSSPAVQPQEQSGPIPASNPSPFKLSGFSDEDMARLEQFLLGAAKDKAAELEASGDNPKAAAQLGGAWSARIDLSTVVTSPPPTLIDWTSGIDVQSTEWRVAGLLIGLGGASVLVCVAILVFWKCHGKRSSARGYPYASNGFIVPRRSSNRRSYELSSRQPFEVM